MNKLLAHQYSPRANEPYSNSYPSPGYNQYQSGARSNVQNSQSFAFGRPQQAEDSLDRFQKEQTLNQSNISQNYQSSPKLETYSPAKNDSQYNSPYLKGNTSLHGSQVNIQNDTTTQRNVMQPSPSYEVQSHTKDTVRSKPNIFTDTRSPGLSNSTVNLRTNHLHNIFDQTMKYDKNTTDQLHHLNGEILQNLKPLERKIEESMKRRPYNILSNQGTSSNSSVYSGMPYGYALKALAKGQEDTKIQQAMKSKGVEYNPFQPMKNYGRDNQETLRNKWPMNVAGKNNYYGETEFRYANKTEMQNPLNQEQIYGIRALKNMSGMKLY